MKIQNSKFKIQNVKIIFCFLLLTAYCLLPTDSYARLGGCGAVFLSIGGGTRAPALGGAYSAYAEGVDAIYWNPAGIAKIRNFSVGSVHAKLYAGMNIENIGVIIPIRDGSIGISAVGLFSGRIERTTYEQQDGTGDYWSANDFALGLSYARRMTDKFNIGVTIKGINQNLDKVSSTGLAFDLGGTYNTKLRGLKFGFVIQNFGPDMAYSGEALEFLATPDETLQEEDKRARYLSDPYQLPLSFQTGLAIDLLSTRTDRLTVMADLVHPSDQEATYAVGGEYCLNRKYFLRIGYTEKNTRGFSAGFGIIMPIRHLGKFTFNYSYVDHRYLAGVHRACIEFEL